MEFLIFGAGMVIGLVIASVRIDKEERAKISGDRHNNWDRNAKAQFIEPVIPKEAFKESEDIDEFLKRLG